MSSTAGSNLRWERLRQNEETLRKRVNIWGDLVAVLIPLLLEVEGPQHARDSEEERAFRDVHSLADTTARAKDELVALRGVWVGGSFTGSLEVISVAGGVELAGVRMSLGVHVDSPVTGQIAGLIGREGERAHTKRSR